MSDHYLIALGSNIRHPRHGDPRCVLGAAVLALDSLGNVVAESDVIDSAPLGPSRRRYANSALILDSSLAPEELLSGLQRLERVFGGRRGQAWSARVLDLDIILWSGGVWASPALAIPHPMFRERDFVLGPAASIAPDWRDPVTSLLLRHLNARLTKPRPIPSGRLR